MNSADSLRPRRLPRNSHLQILRCLAASAVVLDHSLGMYRRTVTGGNATERLEVVLGNTGVMVFFVLSGFLMMRQFYESFGSMRSSIAFLCRRLMRIVPLYWIVTLLWYQKTLFWGYDHLKRQTLLALAFVPDVYSPPPFHPLFQPGWTLNLEILFYVLFACCLLLPRVAGVATLIALLGGLVFIGQVHIIPLTGAMDKILFVYTSEMLLLFLAGVVLALLETRLLTRITFRMRVSPALSLLLVVPIVLWLPWDIWNQPLTLCHYALAVAVVFVCILGKPLGQERLGRAFVVLGDASYSTYLVHVWTLGWVLQWLERITYLRLLSLLLYCVLEMAVAHLLGLAVHVTVERPITRWLQRIPAGAAWFRIRLRQPNLGV
jgi:exopolysaccharide production protein ExoZ